MDRREFLGASALLPLSGIPLVSEKKSESIIGLKTSEDLTDEEKHTLRVRYDNTVCRAAWQVMHGYSVVKGGLIDPMNPLWGRHGEWVLYHQPQPTFTGVAENLHNAVIQAAMWWRRKGPGPFEGNDFDAFIKETIWRRAKTYDGPGEEDGPWADGWEYRCGENPKKLRVIKFFPFANTPSNKIENAEEFFRDLPWIHSGTPQMCKKTLGYLKPEDAVIDCTSKFIWGEVELVLFPSGRIFIRSTDKTRTRSRYVRTSVCFNWELKYGN